MSQAVGQWKKKCDEEEEMFWRYVDLHMKKVEMLWRWVELHVKKVEMLWRQVELHMKKVEVWSSEDGAWSREEGKKWM